MKREKKIPKVVGTFRIDKEILDQAREKAYQKRHSLSAKIADYIKRYAAN